MEFCDFCNNMYYIKQLEDSTMVNYCKNCNSEKQFVNNSSQQTSSHKILTNNFEAGATTYKQYLNENIVHDNTIPHVNNIVCNNQNCTKKESEENDIMYIKYDRVNIKHLYHCVHCKHFWKLNKNSTLRHYIPT